jgi:alpha-D-ribose 1-methylphosphonate 5-triphosphate synthase subunit PhnH
MTAAPRPSEWTASLTAGLTDPVGDAQAIFRAVLTAVSRPGIAQALPVLPPAPPPLGPAAGAILLALADLDAGVWLDAATRTETVAAWVRFHCGAAIAATPAEAPFAVIGNPAALTALDGFALGTPEFPDRAATLIVQVPALAGGPPVTLRGPGIRGTHEMAVDGLPTGFWAAWEANGALFPQGVDILFAGPRAVIGLPRAIRATPEERPCT